MAINSVDANQSRSAERLLSKQREILHEEPFVVLASCLVSLVTEELVNYFPCWVGVCD